MKTPLTVSDKIQIVCTALTAVTAIFAFVAAFQAKQGIRLQSRVALFSSATQVERNVMDYPWLHAPGWVPDVKVTNLISATNYFSGALKALTGTDCPGITNLAALECFVSDNSAPGSTNLRASLQIAAAQVSLVLDSTESAFLAKSLFENAIATFPSGRA